MRRVSPYIHGGWYDCAACGKQTFTTRRDAQSARISFHKGDKGLSAYKSCDRRGFHLGHKPPGSKRRDPR